MASPTCLNLFLFLSLLPGMKDKDVTPLALLHVSRNLCEDHTVAPSSLKDQEINMLQRL